MYNGNCALKIEETEYKSRNNIKLCVIPHSKNNKKYKPSSNVTNNMNISPGEIEPPPGEHSVLALNNDGSYTMKYKNGNVTEFNSDGRVIEKRDRNGNKLEYIYNSSGKIEKIKDSSGRALKFSCNSSDKLRKKEELKRDNG